MHSLFVGRFTAALAWRQGQGILEKIGVEPTGLKFNAILATQIIPQVSVNPLVNSGAIASVSMVQAKRDEPSKVLSMPGGRKVLLLKMRRRRPTSAPCS
jgi:glutaminase